MATPSVGQDIEALCGKCGQVWHVVMAKMGDRIAKVVCKRCGGHHRYRTDGEPADAAARKSSSGSGRRAVRPRTAASEPAVPAFDPSRPPRAYSVRDSYAAGERVSHASFGVGVVSGSPGAGKVDVVFPGGSRVLACAKVGSTLARPVAAMDRPIADRPPK